MADSNPLWVDRLAGLSGVRAYAAALAAGAGFALGQAPISLIWLALPSLCLALFWGMVSADPRQAAWRGWLVGFGFGAVALSWIVEPFLVDVAAHGWMAPFALVFMAAAFGCFWGASFWLAKRLAQGRAIAAVLAFPACLTAAELVRSYLFGGFPWALGSYIWIDTPVYQMAAYIGPHGLTFATLLLCSTFIACLERRRIAGLLACVTVLAITVILGATIQSTVPGDDGRTSPIVRLIQPNADQRQKWDPEMIPVFYQRQLGLTGEKSMPAPDLIIWPEVAVPFLLDDPYAPFQEITDAAGGAAVIIGAQRFDGAQAFNSMAVLGRGGAIGEIYDKQHLVPFGEYLPAAGLLNRLGLQALAAQFGPGYSAGTGPRTLDLGDLGVVLPLICYETIFPQELRRVSERPDWMLLITNDAWFGAFSGPQQHFSQARARTIEFGLPMIRVANTGISAVIDGRGRVVDMLPLGVAGRIDVALPGALPATIYWKTGDYPTMLWLLFTVLIVLRLRRANSD